MKEKIIIYTNENCGYCKELKDILKDKEIEFTEIVTTDYERQWNKVQAITHMSTTPTILFKDSYFIPERDFNHPGQAVQILNSYEKPDLNSGDVMLERMKTLNYNIVFALSTLDRVIKNINGKLR
jgi:glutaredoxin